MKSKFHLIVFIWTLQMSNVDRVSHQTLLTKLYNINIGISGNLINWFKDFLKERVQRVVVNNEFSDWARVVSGIP